MRNKSGNHHKNSTENQAAVVFDAAISLRRSDNPRLRYKSGDMLYEEQFQDGTLTGRYWSASRNIREGNQAPAFHFNVPAQSFNLCIDGQSLHHGWKFDGAKTWDDAQGQRGLIELVHSVRPVRVKIHSFLDGTPFMVRHLEITNTGKTPAAISSMDVFAGVLEYGSEVFREPDFYQTPYSLGRYAGNNWSKEGMFFWDTLKNGATTHLEPSGPLGTSGYQCPYFLIRSENNPEYFVFYLAWSGPWQAHVLCDTTLHQMLHVRLGPASPAPMRILEPGETALSPAAHIGHMHGDLDKCAQTSHEHLRRSVIPKSEKIPRPLVQYNAYAASIYSEEGAGEARVLRDIETAKTLGCEAFVLDCDWFGKDRPTASATYVYPRYVGDWTPAAWLPHGLEPIIRKVREAKMLFGMWVEPEGIGLKSDLYKKHPDWAVKTHNGFLPQAGERATLDYANPEVVRRVESELTRMVKEYRLDILRIDAGPMAAIVGEREYMGYIENTSWRHYEILYGILDKVRRKFPDLIIENCCGGGGRNDLGMLSRTHWTQISDEAHLPKTAQVINGITLMLPPETCLSFCTTNGVYEHADFDSMARILLFGRFYLFGAGRYINPDSSDLAPLRRYVKLYKEFMAPILAESRIYHHTPVVFLGGEQKTDYIAIECAGPDRKKSFAGIFKLTGTNEPYMFNPRGLDDGKNYKVTFDNTDTACMASGFELKQRGLRIDLSRPLTSELLLFEAE